ncbi:hypothetical protein NHX12_020500 [Muraenolepis orangiensis]|uniref:Uncharacterized protein n=1 Tax=Muraenolepis orangiensis TaxID=630683 RepID=A0A9Q0ERK3_9TELE|nr:hypothetical protein NHX12_020500 [Muraenolepis orangiensis]
MDHVYLKTTIGNRHFSSDTTYRLTPTEVDTMVKLRMSNRAYFSGKRNASMRGWRAILKHMGLHTKMTFNQAAKKWDNMRKKYKELRYPPEGVKVFPLVWIYFPLMDNAMHGLLDNSAPLIQLLPDDGEEDTDLLPRHNKRKRGPNATAAAAAATAAAEALIPQLSLGAAACASEMHVALHSSKEEEEEEEEEEEREEEEDEEEAAARRNGGEISQADLWFAAHDAESERATMGAERQLMERERQLMAKESLALERERVALEREAAALERDRAALERERTAVEREKVLMERERAMLERDRAELSRERLRMERTWGRPVIHAAARESGVRGNAANDNSHSGDHRGGGRAKAAEEEEEEEDHREAAEGGGEEETSQQRRRRFLALFEKLVENF